MNVLAIKSVFSIAAWITIDAQDPGIVRKVFIVTMECVC